MGRIYFCFLGRSSMPHGTIMSEQNGGLNCICPHCKKELPARYGLEHIICDSCDGFGSVPADDNNSEMPYTNCVACGGTGYIVQIRKWLQEK